MNVSRKTRRLIAAAVCAGMLSGNNASAVPLCIDAVNPQYFHYKGKTTPLIGYSPEYICHIEQRSNTPQVQHLCNYNLDAASGKRNYQRVIDELALRHLNVLRIWVGLGHSPSHDPDAPMGPLPHEQPFAYNAATGKWDLHTWNQTFFDRLEDVVAYAQLKDVIVELTLFDAFSGDFRTSPWYFGKNSNNFVGLGDEWTLTAVPGTTCAPFNNADNIYSRQKALVEKLIVEVNAYDNVYWELANEPELSKVRAGHDSSGVAIDDAVSVPRIVKWHECMTDIVRNAEGTAAAPKRHLIAANYHTQTALAPFRTIVSPAYAPHVKILTGHYIQVRDAGRLSATEKQRTYLSSGLQGINRVYGFNEGRPTPSYRTTPKFDYITPDEARAEAWEFMLGEGGIYNHYTTDWSATAGSEPQQIRVQLGKLADFIAGFGPNLRHMSRSINNPPTWAPNLPAFGTPTIGGNLYWAAMHQPGSAYALYIHHSKLSSEPFKAYMRPAAIAPLANITLQPAMAPANYTAQWIDPATGSVLKTFAIVADGSPQSYKVPPYSYDIALKISNGTSTPSTGTCAL